MQKMAFSQPGSVKNQLSWKYFIQITVSIIFIEIYLFAWIDSDWLSCELCVQRSIALSFIKLLLNISILNWARSRIWLSIQAERFSVRHSNIHVKMQRNVSNTIKLANVQMICNFNKIFFSLPSSQRENFSKFDLISFGSLSMYSLCWSNIHDR